MSPQRSSCLWKLQALGGGLRAAAAAAAHSEGNHTRQLQQEQPSQGAGNDAWGQVAAAINEGFCAKNYDISSVAETMDDDPQKWVEAHNYYRACHGSQPVTWDTTLAAYAKNWVEVLLTHCDSVEDAQGFVRASGKEPHDPASYTDEVPKNGENLALFEFPVVQMLPMDETSTVEAWYREIDSECENRGLTPGCVGGMNHFTALIWKSVSLIGCYSASRGSFKLVSCRYAPGQALEGEFCNLPNAGAEGDCASRPEDPMVPALVNGQHCEPHGVIGVNGLPNGGAMDIAGQKVIPLPLLVWGWLQRAFTSHQQGPAPAPVPLGTLPQNMMGDHLPQNAEQVQQPQRLFGTGPRPRPPAGARPLSGAAAPVALAALAALAAPAAAAAACRARRGVDAAGLEGHVLLEGSTSEQ